MKKIILIFALLGFICAVQAQTASDFRADANAGDKVAQYNLGVCYQNGDGVEKNFTQAAYWWRKAADQGEALAQFNLGVCYDNGYGVEKNSTQAVYWYRKAADQGEALAQNNLGLCYENGDGVEKNFTQAVYWWRKAAEQGNAKAQGWLGTCYKKGDGVTKDLKTALYWYKQSAAGGDSYGQIQLAVAYWIGMEGVLEKDGNTALYWFEKVASNENSSELDKTLAESNTERLKADGYSSSRSKLKIEDIVRLTPKKSEASTRTSPNTAAYLTATPDDITFPSSGGTKTITIGCNAAWEVKIKPNTGNIGEHCTISRSGSSITINCPAANKTVEAESGIKSVCLGFLEVTSGSKQVLIGVYQEPFIVKSNQPSAKINNVWVDYNYNSGGQLGMLIHVNFDANNMQYKEGNVAAYFFYSNGNPLNNLNILRKFSI